ncbi:MAG: hypothetical protein KC561_04235 [Myxococcales bacterium]|nr:hypothetical protein [Myxococcales bacterium]
MSDQNHADPTAAPEPGTFDHFLKGAVREYFERHGKKNPADFTALLLAVGGLTTASMAWDSVRSGNLPRKVAYGAVGLVALRYGLSAVLTGPLAALATGAAIAGAGSYVIKSQPDVTANSRRFKAILSDARTRFDEVSAGLESGRLTSDECDMIFAGMRAQLINNLLAPPTTAVQPV